MLILFVLAGLGARWQLALPRHLEISIGESSLKVVADWGGLRQLARLVEQERLAGDLLGPTGANLLPMRSAGFTIRGPISTWKRN